MITIGYIAIVAGLWLGAGLLIGYMRGRARGRGEVESASEAITREEKLHSDLKNGDYL